jgi:hypothetical protein
LQIWKVHGIAGLLGVRSDNWLVTHCESVEEAFSAAAHRYKVSPELFYPDIQ